jgi:hypothetical protein
MNRILVTFAFLLITTVMFAQTNARERSEDTNLPEIDNLSGLKPDESDLNPSVANDLSSGTLENGNTTIGDEGATHTGSYTGDNIKLDSGNPIQDAQVYPNPATDYIYVSTGVTEGTIHVLNLLGQEVMQTTINSPVMSLNISDLKEGIYFVSIENGENKIVKKIKVL